MSHGFDTKRLGRIPAFLAAKYVSTGRLPHAATLVSRRGGVEVRVSGRALGDAGENERVAVENLSTRRVLQGRVGPGGDVVVSR